MIDTKKPILIFDMDDTLIPTQELFNKISLVVANLINEILSIVLDSKQMIEKMNEIDLQNVKQMGFSPERFPTSWVQTLEYYSEIHQKTVTSEQKQQIYKQAYSLYETPLESYPFTHKTLAELKELGYPMILLTAGTNTIQEKRIKDADLSSYFQELIIVPTKNPVILNELLKDREINPANAYMIGNSLKSDIYPALEVGMEVVHLERNTWAYDNYEIDKNREEYCVIRSIEELIPIFKGD